MKSIDEAANCIEATNTPQSAAFNTRVAQDIRDGKADLNGLEAIERDCRRQIQAVRFVRRACGMRAEG